MATERVPDGCPLRVGQLRVLRCALKLGTSSARRIAEELGCSRQTVRTHFRDIDAALKVHGVLGAVIRALREGWLDIGEAGSGGGMAAARPGGAESA